MKIETYILTVVGIATTLLGGLYVEPTLIAIGLGIFSLPAFMSDSATPATQVGPAREEMRRVLGLPDAKEEFLELEAAVREELPDYEPSVIAASAAKALDMPVVEGTENTLVYTRGRPGNGTYIARDRDESPFNFDSESPAEKLQRKKQEIEAIDQ